MGVGVPPFSDQVSLADPCVNAVHSPLPFFSDRVAGPTTTAVLLLNN